jgi:hypothetical protein
LSQFRGFVSSVAPLLIQIGSGSTTALITEFSAQGENFVGAASRPTLSRPSTPGVGTGTALALDPAHPAAAAAIVTNFSTLPSLPTPTSGAFNLPIRMRWVAPPRQAFVVQPSAYALLYAVGSGGHLWSGEISWVER